MGGSRHDDNVYESRKRTARETGVDYFAHTARVERGEAPRGVHEKLDPKKQNALGVVTRESFDSDANPNSRGIGILFDVTGSMRDTPRVFVEKLGKLMRMMVAKGYVPDPHILFGAVGDAYSDKAPLQVGQFEGGNEMDEVLSLIYLEGNGGGGVACESYDLGMYFMATKADMHCWTKRGQKGYLFLVGDELPYPKTLKSHIKKVIGDDVQGDIPLEQVLQMVREKFEVFWLFPSKGTNHGTDQSVIQPLKQMFGQNFIDLGSPENICEMVAATIGACEGFDIDDVQRDLTEVGVDVSTAQRVTSSLSGYAKTRARSSEGGALATRVADDEEVQRL
jgi:hypothetical protein